MDAVEGQRRLDDLISPNDLMTQRERRGSEVTVPGTERLGADDRRPEPRACGARPSFEGRCMAARREDEPAAHTLRVHVDTPNPHVLVHCLHSTRAALHEVTSSDRLHQD